MSVGRMKFPDDVGHVKPKCPSGANLKTRIFWLNIKTPKVLLEDRQSGVDGGFPIQQLAGTNLKARSASP